MKFDEVFKTIDYPSGEFHLQLATRPRSGNTIVANVVDFNGLAKCVVGDRILQRNRIDVDWIIPFFPFARDDRRNSNKDGMELKLALDIISELGAAVVDPHSDVTSQRIKYFPQSEVVREFAANGLFEGRPIVAIPDAGAAKKVYTWLGDYEVIQCLKKRDPTTGRLSGFQVINSSISLKNRDIIIVDDICDGGGTFLGLADELMKYHPNSLRLAVTHGLFTKGIEILLERFDQIFTLDHIQNTKYNRVKLCSLDNIIERRNCI